MKRRRNAAANRTSASARMATTIGTSVAVEPATASSTADRVSSGPIASRLTPSAEATSAVIATPRWRMEARARRRIQPGVGASGTDPR